MPTGNLIVKEKLYCLVTLDRLTIGVSGSSASDHSPFFWPGELHLSNLERVARGEFWSSEDGQNIIIHPMYSCDNVDALSLDVWVLEHVLQPLHQAHLIISHFSGSGSCICQTWKGSPRSEFWSSEDGQNIIIHPMYSFDNVDALSLDVWVPDQVLQLSTQAHLFISDYSGRGGCICQTWKGLPRGKFGSSEDDQNIIIHPMYSCDNIDALSLDVWGPDHVLHLSNQAHLIISYYSGRGSCICQTWKGSPRGEFWSSEDSQNNRLLDGFSF
jgi:hypothetical protein